MLPLPREWFGSRGSETRNGVVFKQECATALRGEDRCRKCFNDATHHLCTPHFLTQASTSPDLFWTHTTPMHVVQGWGWGRMRHGPPHVLVGALSHTPKLHYNHSLLTSLHCTHAHLHHTHTCSPHTAIFQKKKKQKKHFLKKKSTF